MGTELFWQCKGNRLKISDELYGTRCKNEMNVVDFLVTPITKLDFKLKKTAYSLTVLTVAALYTMSK